jgi:hypothetical protein
MMPRVTRISKDAEVETGVTVLQLSEKLEPEHLESFSWGTGAHDRSRIAEALGDLRCMHLHIVCTYLRNWDSALALYPSKRLHHAAAPFHKPEDIPMQGLARECLLSFCILFDR